MNSVKWIVCFLLLPSCWAQFLCPDVAELGSSLLLTCVLSETDTTFINTPYGTTMTCILSLCWTQDRRLISNTTLNTTHVIPEVNNVQEKDGGTWTCGPQDDQTLCELTVFQVPSCEISSETDTDKLHIGEEIRLSVTVEDHFCSDLIDFQLQTGFVTEKLVDDLRVDVANSTDVFSSTFRISDSHIGFVQLLFSCNTARKIIPCGGMKNLLRLQQCNIRHDGDTDDRAIVADVGQELSLEVQVEEYYCAGNLSYLLLAGDAGEQLDRRNETGNYIRRNIYNSTFTVTEAYFGSVTLQQMCNAVKWNLSCGGVQKLVQDKHGYTQESQDLLFGIGIGIGIGVTVTLLIGGTCLLVKRKWHCLKVGVEASPSDMIRINQPGSPRRPASLAQSEDGAYEMPRNSYEDLHRNVDTASERYEILTPYLTPTI